MKALPIALFIASLILPVGTCNFPESAAANQRSGAALLAFKYSAERSAEKGPDHSAVCWYERKDNTELKGVALVIHGLNVRPGKMEPIITQMTKAGIDCLNLSLRGHGTNYSDLKDAESDKARMATFKSVSYPQWKSEAYDAYQLAKKKCNLYGAPMFFVGFSMGGLLGVDLFTSNSNVRFDKMVLFAPAIKMRQRNYFLKIFSSFPKLVLPSMAHRSYLANSGTPMAAYNALFDMYRHFENHPDPKINVPTVVFVDKHDELISFSGLQNMVRDQKLDQWEIHSVKKDKTATKIKMHHLIIDAASVGEKPWQEIVAVTITHLLAEF